MLQIIVENEYGDKLNLCEVKGYIVKATGLTPVSATINTSKSATMNGSKYNSSRLNERNIVLQIIPRNDIERNRINLYKYIKSGRYIKLHLKNNSRDVWIDGYVENFEGDLYVETQQLQVSILCPDPYFKSIDEITYEFSAVTPLFTFPFSISEEGVPISSLITYTEKNILNTSDEETGMIIELHATSTVLEPTLYNMTTNEHFTINHEFKAGDIIRINTKRGQKSIILVRDGEESNIVNLMEKNSKWLNLVVGDNMFAYTTLHGTENLLVKVTVQPIFEGV